jgi:hypothetical protein
MDSITTHAAGYGSAPAVTSPPLIELRGIIADGDQLHAVFLAGREQRIVPVERRDLTSFAEFRGRVAAFLGVRVQFSGDWSDAVAAAFQRGAAV